MILQKLIFDHFCPLYGQTQQFSYFCVNNYNNLKCSPNRALGISRSWGFQRILQNLNFLVHILKKVYIIGKGRHSGAKIRTWYLKKLKSVWISFFLQKIPQYSQVKMEKLIILGRQRYQSISDLTRPTNRILVFWRA